MVEMIPHSQICGLGKHENGVDDDASPGNHLGDGAATRMATGEMLAPRSR